MSTIAFALGLWRERQSTGGYRRQIEVLRKELGEVVVADPTKLTVQPIENGIDVWRHFCWRVYVPAGHGGQVKLTITSDAAPNRVRRASLWLESGHSGFEVSALRHPSGESWLWELRDSTQQSGGVSGPEPPWFNGEVSMLDLHDPGRPPIAVEKQQQAELLRHAGVLPNGERVEVILTVDHYPPKAQPSAKVSAGTERLPD